VTLHDGSTIDVTVHGTGHTLLLPVNPRPVEGPQAEEMRKWGADPALGRSLMDGLGERVRVAAFDYEGHVLAHPMPETLTPDNICADFLAVADAVGAERFAYYGYSWFGLSGLQLALRTERLSALVMGGFPPVDGPYAAMLSVTRATHAMAGGPPSGTPASGDAGDAGDAEKPGDSVKPGNSVDSGEPGDTGEHGEPVDEWSQVEVTMSKEQTQQFVTLYEALQDFDDLAAQRRLTCPRLCFAGSADRIEYGERWGGVVVDLAGPIAARRAELEALGWDVALLDGLDHTTAMQAPAVLPIVLPWLAARV